MANGLTHFDKEGNAVMVDVSGKNVTYRTALATGYIAVGPEIMACVTEGNVKKGDVLIEFDPAAIKAEGYQIVTPILVCNPDAFTVEPAASGAVAAGDALLTLKKK